MRDSEGFYTCPGEPIRGDTDGDGEGDVCDMDDGILNILHGAPDRWRWHPERYFRWNFYSGDLAILRARGAYTQAPGSNPQALRACNLQQPQIEDDMTPAPGSVAFVLVTGTSPSAEGNLGEASDGSPRANSNPCP